MTQRDLPRLSHRLLRAVLHPDDRRFALDDLEEDFERRLDRGGRQQARRWYRAQVFRSVLPAAASRLGRLPRNILVDVIDDSRYVIRTLVKAPLVPIITVISLAIGIAAATSVFTAANAFLMRPMSSAITDPHELVAIYTVEGDGDRYDVTSYPDYQDIVRQIDAFDDVAAVRMGILQIDDADQRRRIAVEIVTGNYFDLLGLQMPLGRAFLPGETTLGRAERVAVISHGLWQRRFGGSPDVVGETLDLDGFPFTVIGVAPADLTSRMLALKIDAWVPLGIPGGTYHSDERELSDRGDREHALVARMAAGVSTEQAQTQLDLLSSRLHSEYREDWEDEHAQPLSLRLVSGANAHMPPDWVVALGAAMGLVMGAAALVLLVACFNVASLFLARAGIRAREMAVRLALGASRRRLVTMLLTESLLLALLAGGLGTFLSTRVMALIDSVSLPIGGLTINFDFSVDYRVLMFTLALSAGTSIVFGLAPALEASKPSLLPALKGDSIDTRRHRRFGMRNLLVIAQIATALIFVVGTGVTLTSFQALLHADWGVTTDRIALMSKNLPEEIAEDAFVPYYHELMARLDNHPEVEEVQLARASEGGIFAVDNTVELRVDGYERAAGESLTVPFNAVTPGYMELVAIRMVRGRTIAATDVDGAVRAAIVTESFAQRFWGDRDGLGERFSIVSRREMGDPIRQEPVGYEVVGIAADAPYQGFESSGRMYVWASLYQHPARRVMLVVQGRNSAEAVVRVLADEVDPQDRELALVTPQTYQELVEYQFAYLTWAAKALAAAGLFGLALATMGIYGTVTFAVQRRGRELAIRQAVGALPQQVMRAVLREGVVLSLWGLLAGLTIVVPIMMLARADIEGVSSIDPVSTLLGAAVLLLVSLVASALPARRVTRIDPVSALRQD